MSKDSLDIHIFLHSQDQSGVMQQLTAIKSTLGEFKMTLDDLVTKVTAENTVIDSAVTLLSTIKAELDAAIASGDPAKVQAVADLIDAGQKKLADAVVANTPAAP